MNKPIKTVNDLIEAARPAFDGIIEEATERLVDALSRASPASFAHLQDHEKRVVAERYELETRIHKLHQFIDTSGVFLKLEPGERVTLRKQVQYMECYSDILGERITRFTRV